MTESSRSLTGKVKLFPVMNFVVAIGVLMFALLSIEIASRAGYLVSHSTSIVDWLVTRFALLAIVAATVLEAVAIARALVCFARHPATRTSVHGFLSFFSIVVFAGFFFFAFGWHR